VSHASKRAELLLAHARLCRDIAGASRNEEAAEKLAQLAEACVRAATDVGRDGGAGRFIDRIAPRGRDRFGKYVNLFTNCARYFG